jgi:hypothetical protein
MGPWLKSRIRKDPKIRGEKSCEAGVNHDQNGNSIISVPMGTKSSSWRCGSEPENKTFGIREWTANWWRIN